MLGREMTKTFEEFVCGTAQEVLDKLKVEKGEFALCILPSANTEREDGEEDNAD